MLLDKRIPLKYILGKVKVDLALVISFVTVIVALKKFYNLNFELTIAIPAFLGTAISLVLAFKLSHSYDRWWEARKIWGAIVNDSRSLILQLKNFCKTDEESNVIIKRIGLRQIAWCYSLASSLRNLDPFENIGNLISEKDRDNLASQSNIPLKLIDFNSNDVEALHLAKRINDYQQVHIDQTFVRLCASMGKAERIKNTVFPKTYRIFLRLFIYVFILTLAISLSNLNPAIEFPLLIAISLPFFLLKKTAHHMQDPFNNKPTDTSMSSIARTIEINIKQLINIEEVPEAHKPDGKFYIM